MTTLLLVSASILLVFAIYTLAAPLALNVGRFAGSFRVDCPAKHLSADVKVHATQAALSSAYGTPALQLRRCNLLHEGDRCNEACLKGLQA